VQYGHAAYLTVFFLPIVPVGNHREMYECQGCYQSFGAEANFPYDFGDHPNPKIWTCSRCKTDNPSHAHYCRACGGS